MQFNSTIECPVCEHVTSQIRTDLDEPYITCPECATQHLIGDVLVSEEEVEPKTKYILIETTVDEEMPLTQDSSVSDSRGIFTFITDSEGCICDISVNTIFRDDLDQVRSTIANAEIMMPTEEDGQHLPTLLLTSMGGGGGISFPIDEDLALQLREAAQQVLTSAS